MITAKPKQLFVSETQQSRPTHIGFLWAHPDDSILHSFALAERIADGSTITTLTATRGERLRKSPRFSWQGHRVVEDRFALNALGIPCHQQPQLDLPDMELRTPRYLQKLSLAIATVALQRNIEILYSLGSAGVDEHPDHIASHESALRASAIVKNHREQPLHVFGLARMGATTILHVGGIETKLRLASLYPSQFPNPSSVADELAIAYGDLGKPESFEIAA